jgi:zona occludens toxin
MINLILGQPGGGKSYEAVAFHVIPALVDGRRVITNLPLQVDVIEAYFPGASRLIQLRHPQLEDGVLVRPFSRVEHYGDAWRHPESGVGPLYVIDECHLAMPRTVVDRSQVAAQRLVEEWYSMHRHELADVLLITQSYGKVNKAVIDLVQVVYRCKKATAFGSSKRYIRKVQDGVRGEVVNTAIREYESKFFKFYRSHTKSSAAAEELTAGDIVPLWKRWPFKGAAICAVIVAGLVSYQLTRDKPAVHSAPKAVSPSVSAAPARSAPDAVPADVAVPRGPAQQLHPYQGYDLFLSALMHGQRSGVPYLNGYITVTQNGQPIRQVSFRELTDAGYQISYQSETVIALRYKDLDLGFVVSALPTVSLASKAAGG